MNYSLFIDNFRGFSNTYIPITDVNFLVGQNSTGKTSVLGLMKLFSGPRFLFQQAFEDDEVSFGRFSDIVSAHSEDKSFFRVGLVWEAPAEKKGQKTTTGWLATFFEDEGMPRLSRFTLCRGSHKISLRLNGTDIRYKAETYSESPTVKSILKRLLRQWANEHASAHGKYEKLPMAKDLPSRIPVMVALSMISGESSAKKHKTVRELNAALFSPQAHPPEITWIAPVRTKPKRTYDETRLAFSPEGEHTPNLIRRILRSKSAAARFHAFIQKIGKASGLFQDIRIKNFGPGATAPFELDIVLDGKALNLSTVGYGVSQSLPVLIEVLARGHGSWFAIQQPEVHLHPRAQAALGDMFFEMAATDHKLFLVETHSDFAIDRFRMNYKKKRSDKPDGQILFFERRDKHNVVTPLSIGKSGELPADQPESYRDFFVREELRVLGL
jgi:hypothetical protein